MTTKTLRGKRIAILAADGFEFAELALPKRALKAAGAKVEVVSLHRGRIRGMNLTEPTRTVRVHRTLDEARAKDYDGLFIPSGFVSPDFLRQSQAARAFVRDFDEAEKPIATICHGPWILASAELVSGRTMASWPGIRDDLVHAGAIWRDAPLVSDRNWISSRGPQDLPLFAPAMVKLFAEGRTNEEPAGAVSSAKSLTPAPVAVKAARWLPGPTLRGVVAFAAVMAGGAFAMRVARSTT